MPTAQRSRRIAAPAQDLWELVCDPHHLPRWWPRVIRVEDVQDDAFTEVMKTRKGKVVRADFSVSFRDDATRTLTWVQRIDGTPFASVLKSAETELRLTPATGSDAQDAATAFGEESQPSPTYAAATDVTIELRQEMVSHSRQPGLLLSIAPRFGSPLVRRAAADTLDRALDGLEQISV